MNRIRHIVLLLLTLVSTQTLCQSISVKSFRLLEMDLTANTAGTTELDQNGDKAALIKVVTTETGFSFDCGSIGVVKTVQKPSEIWVYVPQGARRMTISHPRLGILRDYEIPMPIEKARTYEMVLTTGQIQTIVQQDAGGQYLIMKVSPPSAIVKIDNIEAQVENGIVSKFLQYGKHIYSVSDPFYKDDQGFIEIGSERKEMDIYLSPNYGKLLLSSNPENGAKVIIDGETKIAGYTPFTTDKLTKGKHNFRFQLAQYATKDTIITVNGDGNTKEVAVSMDANFGNIKITAPENSNIYINNVNKGRSYWKGRLTEGMYYIEAKKDSYRTTSKSINVVRGQDQDIVLDAPSPIFGMININSHPVGASVYVDGKMIGTTPNVFNNILVGSRTITLTNKGYQDYTSNINIEEGKLSNIDAYLKETVNLDNDARASIIKDRYLMPSKPDDHLNGKKPLTTAEKMPSFKGNINEWLSNHIVYPAVAAENGFHGIVIVRFVVGKDGSISQASVVRSVDPSLDREALRLVNSMPKWNPGLYNGEPVAVWFTCPVTFRLN